jgi:hypothetical protein
MNLPTAKLRGISETNLVKQRGIAANRGILNPFQIKRIMLSSLYCILLLITACNSLFIQRDESIIDIKPNIRIEKVDYSVFGENGKKLANFYYEKPILQGDTEAVLVINDYFIKESKDFLKGENKLSQYQAKHSELFFKTIRKFRSICGDAAFEEEPFSNIVDTKVAFINGKLLSIKQITYWMAGGISNQFYYGSTFSLTNGDLLALDYFIKVDEEDFYREFINLLIDTLSNTYIEYNKTSIEQIYCNLKLNEFEYYYDGLYIYIALNEGIFNGDGCLLKWNGLFGEYCKATLIGYPMINGSFELIDYSTYKL